MSRLLNIKKEGDNNWWHYDSYIEQPYFVSNFAVDVDADKFQIIRFSGARGYEYLWSDITVQIGGGSPTSFASREELIDFLVLNNYPPFISSASGTPTVTTIFRAGDVLEISRPIEYFTDNFDLEDPESDTYGQGKNERVGWWLETGKGGTRDTRNKFKFQWNPEDNVKYPLGDIGGFENAVLLAHKHNTLEYSDGKFGVNTLGTGASSAGRAISESGATAPIDETSLFGIDENGSPSDTEDGEGKNMPPYIVTAFAMRTEDLVIIGGGNAIPSLPQVLAISDLPSNFEGIATDTFVNIIVGWELQENYLDTDGVESGGLFLSKDITFRDNSTINFQAGWVSTDSEETKVLSPYRFTTDAIVFFDGSPVTDILIQPTQKCTLKYQGYVSESETTIWVLSISNKPSPDFELQFTQIVVDDPPIILEGSIKGNKGATITPSRVSSGIYRFTADLPIFADLKDCYKRTDFFDLQILQYNGLPSTFCWYWYCVSDTVLEAVVFDSIGGSPADELLTNNVLLKAEYKF